MSFSGDTEETVEAATAAYEAGAALVTVSGGGELVRLSGEWGVPLVPVPAAIPEARTALGAMAVPAARAARVASACSPGRGSGSTSPWTS